MSGLVRPDVPPTTISTSVHRFFLVWASEKEHILNYLINTEDNTLGDMSARQPPKCHKSTNPSRPFFQTRNGDPSTTVSLVIYAAIRKKKKKKLRQNMRGKKTFGWVEGYVGNAAKRYRELEVNFLWVVTLFSKLVRPFLTLKCYNNDLNRMSGGDRIRS